jgi:methionyl-tRNA synthetase
MYVWFDALVNYISTIGWPHDMKSFDKWWPVVQFAGKDQVRQQAAMWQAMLMSVGIKPSKQIIIHGFIQSGGQKMSKSLGNVIDPYAVVSEYGTEALRYFLAREVTFFEDSDFTMERFKNAYNTNLANGLGNLISRVMKMATTNLAGPIKVPKDTILNDFKSAMDLYDVQAAANIVWKHITEADQMIQVKEPFKLVKTDKLAGVKVIESFASVSTLLVEC